MARIYEELDEYHHGRLEVKKGSADYAEVFYIPSREKLQQSTLDPESSSDHRVKLLEFDGINHSITIFPTNTLGGHKDFLKPKYNQIRRITLAYGKTVLYPSDGDAPLGSEGAFKSPYFGPTKLLGKVSADFDSLQSVPSTDRDVMLVLEELPSAFTKDYDYGLGLAKPYRFIVSAVEQLSDCTEIVISHEQQTDINKDREVFYISVDDFETARKILNSTTQISRTAARSVKDANVRNLLAERIGAPRVPVAAGRHPVRKLFTSAVQNKQALSDDEQAVVLDAIEKNVKTILESKPEKLVRLQSDIELATLEQLILRFEEMIEKNHPESRWQEFLNENPFILNLAFGYPIIKVRDQATIGGRDISGSGDKIVDFLVKEALIKLHMDYVDMKSYI